LGDCSDHGLSVQQNDCLVRENTDRILTWDHPLNQFPIHIALASDIRGVTGLAVTVHSALQATERPVHVWIVQEGIDLHTQRRLLASWKAFANLAGAHFLDMRQLPIKLPQWWARSRWPMSAASRFQLPLLMPKDAHRCIYLDIDILVGADLGELYDIDMAGHPVAMTPATELSSDENRAYIVSLGLQPETYCNSGVLLMDLTAWRRERASEALIAMGRGMRPDLWFFDQDMLNTFFKGRCLLLDPLWNYRDALATNQGRVQHFVGSPKPWQTKSGDSAAAGLVAWHATRAANAFQPFPASPLSRLVRVWRLAIARIQRTWLRLGR